MGEARAGQGGPGRPRAFGVRPAVNRLFTVATAVAAAVATLFLLLPIVAIFSRVPLGDLLSALGSGQAVDALVVTVETNLIALAIILLFGTPTAWLIATRAPRLRDLAVTLVELPLVLPPAVAGIGLLAAFGRARPDRRSRRTWVGDVLAFTKAAVVLAVDLRREPVLRSLGDRRVRGRRPDAACGPRARSARARAGPSSGSRCRSPPAGSARGRRSRSPAGSASSARRSCSPAACAGVTQTLPLAIYEAFDVDFDLALAISAELVAVSAAILLAAKSCSAMALHARLRPSSSLLRARGSARGRARDARARRAVGSRQDDRAARGRRAGAAGARADRRSTARRCSTRAAAICLPRSGGSVGLVFQDYALFPHLSVEANVGFGGARARGRAARAVPDRAPREGAAGRALRRRAPAGRARPRARARPGRAPARRADGRARRAHARRRPGRAAGAAPRPRRCPTILVTHDFEDAAALADRVGVIADGTDAPARRRRTSSSPRRPTRSSPASPAATSCTASPGPTREGLTEVVLDGGAVVFSTDRGRGPRRRGRLPVGGLDRAHRRGRLGAEPRERADLVARARSATASASGSGRSSAR